jgi:hypothetical protein
MGRTPISVRRGVLRVWLREPDRVGVPVSQQDDMRAPLNEGDHRVPVKNGNLGVGVVEDGPRALLGRTVFCSFPHQAGHSVPAHADAIIWDGIPPTPTSRSWAAPIAEIFLGLTAAAS